VIEVLSQLRTTATAWRGAALDQFPFLALSAEPTARI